MSPKIVKGKKKIRAEVNAVENKNTKLSKPELLKMTNFYQNRSRKKNRSHKYYQDT